MLLAEYTAQTRWNAVETTIKFDCNGIIFALLQKGQKMTLASREAYPPYATMNVAWYEIVYVWPYNKYFNIFF